MFAFQIQDSEQLAKKIVEDHGGMCGSWNDVCKCFSERKRALIERISPETARCEQKIDLQPINSEVGLKTKLADAVGGMHSWICSIGAEDARTEQVAPDSGLTVKYGAKVGQKLSRALATICRQQEGVCAEDASRIIGQAFDAWKAGMSGTIVLSANILDMVTSSYSCAWSSCHRLNGEFKGGSFQYLADPFTCIAYFYTEARRDKCGEQLPYKVWRQLLHVDIPNQVALFMRNYGTEIHDDSHKVLRRMVAKVISGDEKLNWTCIHPLPEKDLVQSDESSKMAYVDRPVMAIRHGNHMPRFKLATDVVCPNCAAKGLWNPANLFCNRCHENIKFCCECGKSIVNGQAAKLDDDWLCGKCVCRYQKCCTCDRLCRIGRAASVGGSLYCDRCQRAFLTICDLCRKFHLKDNVAMTGVGQYTALVCQQCAVLHVRNCGGCSRPCLKKSLRTDKFLCPNCQPKAVSINAGTVIWRSA